MLRKCSDSVRSTPLFSAFFFENSLLGMHFGLLLQLVTCSFISMEGELTQNQGFLRLSEKCRDVLPLEHSVLDDHWSPLTPMNLSDMSALFCNS